MTTPIFMTPAEILTHAENDYHGLVSKVKNGAISTGEVAHAIQSLDNRFENLEVEVRTGTIDYLWMGFTLRGENSFGDVILPIAEFAEGLAFQAVAQSEDARSNVFEFEVEVGQVMEPATITENFTFFYSDDLNYWEIKSDFDTLSYVGEESEPVSELVTRHYEDFSNVNDRYDYLMATASEQG